RREAPGNDDRQAKTAGGHGVLLRLFVLVEGDLHARHVAKLFHLGHQRWRRMAIARPMRRKQHDAVAVAPVAVGKDPALLVIEANEGLDPAGAVKIRPLVADAQVHLDHATADRFDVDDAGVAAQVPPYPGAAVILDEWIAGGMDDPLAKRALPARGAC